MRTQKQVEGKALAIISAGMPTEDDIAAVRALSAAGLLATPTLLRCADACMAMRDGWATVPDGRRAEIVEAGRAHAATLAPRERYASYSGLLGAGVWDIEEDRLLTHSEAAARLNAESAK